MWAGAHLTVNMYCMLGGWSQHVPLYGVHVCRDGMVVCCESSFCILVAAAHVSFPHKVTLSQTHGILILNQSVVVSVAGGQC